MNPWVGVALPAEGAPINWQDNLVGWLGMGKKKVPLCGTLYFIICRLTAKT